jgi:hypothetical protein
VAAVEPDLFGLQEAQRRLRGWFGENVIFLQASEYTYPAGTPIDPETGEPYDPTIEPESVNTPGTSVQCDVALVTGVEDDGTHSAAGVFDATHYLLIADIGERNNCEPAQTCVVRNESCTIVAQKPDGIGFEQRWLVWARRNR